MRPSALFLAAAILFLPPASAEDFVRWSAKGDVVGMDIYSHAATGAYGFTKLAIAVRPEDPTLFVINDYFIVTCDGEGGGDRTNCQYPGAFLGGSACAPIRVIEYPAEYVPYPIDGHFTVTRHLCREGARRDAGECVLVEGYQQLVFTQSSTQQVLWPWIETIDWVTGCRSKNY